MTAAQILVVDDEVGMVTLLRNSLTRAGYAVTTAPSAAVALQVLEKHDIDVVLTDMRMPGMGGMELVREIHASRPETHVILMTAFGSRDVAVEAVQARAYHFVTKPVKLPEVGALVHKALTERTLRQENRYVRQAVEERYRCGDLLGTRAGMQRLCGLFERLAATNRDLAHAVRQGTFGEDLSYRLHVMVVHLPPLREHRDDMALLAATFLQRHATANHLEPRHCTLQVLCCLEQDDWPGNVRELSHVIARAVTLSTRARIDVEDLGLASTPPSLPLSWRPRCAAAQEVSLPADTLLNRADLTRHVVTVALQQTHGHKGRAATLLGIHPRTLTRMLRRYALPEA